LLVPNNYDPQFVQGSYFEYDENDPYERTFGESFEEIDRRAEDHPLIPYVRHEDQHSQISEEWDDLVSRPYEDPDLYIAPRDVLVRILHVAYKLWCVQSVQYTVDPYLNRLTLDIRFGGYLFYLMTLINPVLMFWIIPAIIRKAVMNCDTMPSLTKIEEVIVDFSWVSPGYITLDEVRSEEDLVGLLLAEDRKLLESHWGEDSPLLLAYEDLT